jgi:hypothetical protein
MQCTYQHVGQGSRQLNMSGCSNDMVQEATWQILRAAIQECARGNKHVKLPARSMYITSQL